MESSFEKIAALQLELHAAQIEYKLEKLHSQSALEKIMILETQVRYIIANLQHGVQGDIENTNNLSESRQTMSSSVGTVPVDLWRKNIPEDLLSPLEVERLRGRVSSSPDFINHMDGAVQAIGQEDEKNVALDEPVTVFELEDETYVAHVRKNIPKDLLSPLEVERLRGRVSSSLDFINLMDGAVHAIGQEDKENAALDGPMTVFKLEDETYVAHDEPDKENDATHDEPVTLLEAMAIEEREIIRNAIKRFSSSNPRKWIDACKEELKKTYKIKIGSSSLSTRKHRDKHLYK